MYTGLDYFNKLRRLSQFEKIIYSIVYEMEDHRCVYCGKPLKQNEISIDHRYPRCKGGITIIDNLCIACKDCNFKKDSLTMGQYFKAMKIPEEERDSYIRQIKNKQSWGISSKMPKRWFTCLQIGDIKYNEKIFYRSDKEYQKEVKYYKRNLKLKPIVVDMYNQLLDGYYSLKIAKDFSIRELPVVRLDNVIADIKSR